MVFSSIYRKHFNKKFPDMEDALTTTYFSALHDEAYDLLVEARDYIAALRQNNLLGGTKKNAAYLDITLETMRLTSRLTQVMAWILAQKAVHNDELTPEEGASERFRLSGQSVCLVDTPGKAGHLPEDLRELMQRSYDLYCRVGRLEEQICRRLEGGHDAPPVRSEEGPKLRAVTTSDQSPRSAY